jgi:predicted flap endonuclease-1-like 5' DNA nuclease/predicted  nucleic acid-binding Zn-ribbon protein
MQTVVAGLVVLAVAFPAGWLVCRAWMTAQASAAAGDEESIPVARHHELLRAQRSRYRRRVQKIHAVVRKHEATRDQIRDKLTRLQHNMQAEASQTGERDEEVERLRQTTAMLKQALDENRERLEQARSIISGLEEQLATEEGNGSKNELDLLRIERDELSARVRRLQPPPRMAEEQSDDSDTLRAQLGETRENLAARDHRIRELERQLEQHQAQRTELETTVNSWKRRIGPLARQLQLQRELIRRLRSGDSNATTAAAEQAAEPDELQRIRGIGPALQRRLNVQGIYRYEQLALLGEDELTDLADKLAIAPALPMRDEWIAQAQKLYEEKIGATA